MNSFQQSSSYSLLKDSVSRMYAWMAGGLLITAITSSILYQTGWFLLILYKAPILSMVLMFAQLALVMALSFGIRKMTASTMKLMYLLYSLTMGITMTSLAYTYELGTIGLAFGITAMYFLSLVAIGKTTRLDLTKLGNLSIVALVVLVISQLIMLVFRVPIDTRLMSIFGLLIFTGITAYDVQRANALLSGFYGENDIQEKMIVFMALQMYLDFVNIFLYIVRLLGSRKK